MFFKRVENAVGKGEIASQKTCTADTLKPGLVLERVNHEFSNLFRLID